MPALRSIIACLGGAAFIAACSGSNAGVGSAGDGGTSTDGNEPAGSATVSSQAEQLNGSCPSSPQKLKGTASTGSACSTFADCKPSCCDCSSSGSYLAAACVDGLCSSSDVACGRARKAICGDPGGSSGTSGSSGTKQCVDGSSSSCYGVGMTWTGSQCCVDGVSTCTQGTSSSCYGIGKHWTGALCCIEGSTTCVDGTSSSCYGVAMSWTGARCCVDGAVQCVAGTSSSCYGIGKHWTGALCCVD